MALIQPPVTGDPQLDSWTFQLTRQINSGLTQGGVGSSGGGGGSGTDGFDGNSSIYLYQRDTQGETPPPRPTLVSFDFDTQIFTANEGWSADLPTDGGEYLWVTFRYVAGESGDITESASWDTPTLLGVPGDPAINIEIVTDIGTIYRNVDRTELQNIVLTANVYIGGELQSDTAHLSYEYNWQFAGSTIYVTTAVPHTVFPEAGDSGQPRVTAGAALSSLADSNLGGSLRSITVPDTAVAGMAQLSCDVSNI